MDYSPEYLVQKASGEKKQNKRLLKILLKLPSSDIDNKIHILHEKYTEEINCLECGNCCSSISPAVRDRDVDKISKHLRLKPSEIVERYFDMDKDGDYIFRKQPCPFLGEDTYCDIYDSRPKACREYPHTDRVRQQQILNITYRNLAICPIVNCIFDDLKKEYL